MQWSDEKPADLIHILVYEGADGQFTLYEDEGTNYNYERGRYATIPFSYDDTTRRFTIGQRKGNFPGMLKTRKFMVQLIHKGEATPLDLYSPGGILVNYTGKPLTITLRK